MREADALDSGERQVGATLEEIRADHVERYLWARRRIEGIGLPGLRVIDAGCGTGYGAHILAQSPAVATVDAFDCSAAAIDYACEHWPDVKILWSAGQEFRPVADRYDVAVCLEAIEHVADDVGFLARLLVADRLILSTPDGPSWRVPPPRFHVRHYDRDGLAALLTAAGWRGRPAFFWQQREGKGRVLDFAHSRDPDAALQTMLAAVNREPAR